MADRGKPYRRMIFRESAEVVCRKSFTRLMVCKRAFYTAAMTVFLDNPDSVFDKLDDFSLKRGHSSTIVRTSIDGHELVVKRYNIKGFWHGLRRAFMPTRGARSWCNAHRLLMLGIATPEPIALLERRLGLFRGKAYFVSEYMEGPCAVDFFRDVDTCQKPEVARRITEIFKKLELAKISHGDMKGANIVICQQEPVLLDLDAMRAHVSRMRFSIIHRRDIKRFAKNWEGIPEVGRLFVDL